MPTATSIVDAMMSIGAPTWPRRENLMGAPFSELMVCAISSARRPNSSMSRCTAPIRSAAGTRAQSDWSKASRAADTAALDVGCAGIRHSSDHLFGMGFDDINGGCRQWIHPRSADEQPRVVLNSSSHRGAADMRGAVNWLA